VDFFALLGSLSGWELVEGHKMTEDKEFHEDVLNQPEYPSQKTPLHLACLNDYPEIVTFLLSKGVNPNLVDFVNVSQHFYL
jgi:hypothetical protein